jgi:AcrR family transcriptional regulator
MNKPSVGFNIPTVGLSIGECVDRRSDRGQATRQHVLETATRLFTDPGYENTSIEMVLRECGMSRGALYHHFSGKEALFTAVLEAVEARVTSTVREAGQNAANPLDALRAGCDAWLLLARDPTVRRIVLIDAPSVIGWQAWREMDDQNGLGLLKAGLGMAAAAGRVPAGLVDMYAHILLATLTEVAMLIARSDDAAATIEAGRGAVEQIISRLFGVEPNGAW